MHCAVRGVFVDCAELSDPGREPSKQINEDICALAQTGHGLVAVVCDGMGGHSAGREASTTAMRTIVDVLSRDSAGEPGEALVRAIEKAAKDVYKVGGDAPPELRPGSTCVAAVLHDGLAEVAHVGDSRAYLFRGGALTRLTRDHSMVQQMLDSGMLTPEQAIDHPDANKITRALGMMESAEVELRSEPVRLLSGDVLLLCTDGLTDLVEDADLAMLIKSHAEKGPEQLARVLVEVALARGGWDNVTVQLLFVRELGKNQPSTVVLGDEDGDQATAGKTVVDDNASQQTWIDGPGETRPAPSPTLLEEPAPERTTLPGGPGSPISPFNNEDAPGAPPRRGPSPARALVFYAAAITAVIVVGIVVWAVARRVRPAKDDPPPPPPTEQSATKTPVIAPPTELSAAPEEPPPAPDAATEADAALP